MELFKLFGTILIDNDPANRKLQETDAQAEKVGNTLTRVAATAAKWGAAIAAGATAAGGALFALTKRVSDAAGSIDDISQKLGISTTALQEYQYAADQLGISQGQMEKALGRLNQRIGMAERGHQGYKKALEELGVTSRDASEAFVQAVEALHQMEDSNKQAALAADLFGVMLARDLMPAIVAGGDELLNLRNRAHELGKVMDEETVAAGAAFGDALTDIQVILGGITQDIAAKVLPMFATLLTWIMNNLPKVWAVFQFLGEVVGIVFKYLRLMIGDAISWARDHIIGPFVEWLINVWKERGPPIVEAVEGLWEGVKAVFSAVFDTLKGIWEAFVLAFHGDWEDAWTTLKETFSNLWNRIPDLFAGIWGPLVALADNIMTAVIDTIRAVFGDDVADHFQSIWDSVVLVFETFEEVFMGLWRAWSAVFRGDWEAAWTEFKGVAATIWNAIPDVFSGIINGLIGIADTVMQAVIGVIRTVFGDEVAGVFETAWDAVRIVFEAARDVLLGIWTAMTAAFQGDWETAWASIRGVVDTAWSAIQTVIESALEIINTVISGALDGIVALVRFAFGDEAADAVDEVFEVIRTVIDTATEVIMGVVRAFSALFRGEWQAAWDEIKGVATTIWNSLPVIFEQAIDTLVGIADTVMTAVIGVIRSVFGDEVADHFQGVWDAVKLVFETMTDAILGIWRSFSALFQGEWETAWNEVKGVVSGVWNALPDIIEGVLTGLFGIVDAGVQAIINLIRNVFGDGVADAFQNAWDAVTILFQTVVDAIIGIWETFSAVFRGDWEDAWQGIKDVFAGIWNGITSIFTGPLNGITTFVTHWAGRIVGSFVALKDLVLGFVRDMVDGIKEWFSETKLGQTFGWLGDQVNGVIGWFADMYDKVVGNSYVPDMVEEIGEAVERLKDRLANPVVRYTRDVILAFEDMEDEVVASMMSMAERLDDVLKTIVDRISGMISDVTRQFWNGTATWASILDTFAGTIGAIFGSVFDAIAKELVSNLVLQNEWLISTLSSIATTITGFLSQAYAALTAFFWFLGPGAPAAAAATIAAAIAGIAAIGGSIVRGLLPDPPGASGGPSYSGGGHTPTGGRQVSEITGPTRDLLIDLLSPLANLGTLTGIGERIYSLLDERLPAPAGPAFAGAGAMPFAAPQIIFQPGAVVVYSQAGTVQALTGDAVDEIYRQLSERLERSFRGRGR